jgi:hypothetical protein
MEWGVRTRSRSCSVKCGRSPAKRTLDATQAKYAICMAGSGALSLTAIQTNSEHSGTRLAHDITNRVEITPLNLGQRLSSRCCPCVRPVSSSRSSLRETSRPTNFYPLVYPSPILHARCARVTWMGQAPSSNIGCVCNQQRVRACLLPTVRYDGRQQTPTQRCHYRFKLLPPVRLNVSVLWWFSEPLPGVGFHARDSATGR